jgi:hypothetical protein
MTNKELIEYVVSKAKTCTITMNRISKGNYKGAALWMNHSTGVHINGCNKAVNSIAGCNLFTID